MIGWLGGWLGGWLVGWMVWWLVASRSTPPRSDLPDSRIAVDPRIRTPSPGSRIEVGSPTTTRTHPASRIEVDPTHADHSRFLHRGRSPHSGPSPWCPHRGDSPPPLLHPIFPSPPLPSLSIDVATSNFDNQPAGWSFKETGCMKQKRLHTKRIPPASDTCAFTV